MTNKTVQLLDISPFQQSIACLPFGIYDWGHQLLQDLYNEVARRHGDDDNRVIMMNALLARHQLISQNRYALANMHGKPQEKIQVYHLLSSVLEVNGKNVQFVYSDIYVPLHDAKMRLAQLPLCFILSEDLKTWKEIVLNAEQLCVDSEVVSAARQLQDPSNTMQVQQNPRRSKRALNS
jgi:hypothetical protein